LPEIEAALAPFQPRPHWGKLFTADAGYFRRQYPSLPDFRRLAESCDPDGKFRNEFVERCLF